MKLGSKRFWVCFLFWALLFHSWLLVRLIPALEELSFFFPLDAMFVGLLWINIPGIPLSSVMGDRYFPTESFGAMPQGPIAYAILVLFWLIVSAFLAKATSAAIGWWHRRKAAKAAR